MAVQFPSQQAEEQLITSTSFVMVGLPFLSGITNRVSPPSTGLYQYMNIYNVAPFSAVVEQWRIWDARCKLYVNRRLSRSEGSQNLLLFPVLYGSLKEIFFSYTAAKKRTAHAVISLDANIAKAWFMRALVTWCLLLLAMSILTPKKRLYFAGSVNNLPSHVTFIAVSSTLDNQALRYREQKNCEFCIFLTHIFRNNVIYRFAVWDRGGNEKPMCFWPSDSGYFYNTNFVVRYIANVASGKRDHLIAVLVSC